MKKLPFPRLSNLALALALWPLACTQAESPSGRTEALSDPPAENLHRVDPRDVPSPPEPAQANAPISSPEQARLEALLSAMSEAQEQAAAAEGETECERAYESSRRFAGALRERMGGEALPPDTPARKRAFVEACGRLPAAVQRCMVMAYSIAHQEECAGIRREMDEDTESAVQSLMAELGPLGEAAAPPQ